MQTNKKIAVFLDDERIPQFVSNKIPNFDSYEWIIIRNYFEFTDFVDKNIGRISLVSFDHDIDSLEWNGKDAADYLLEVLMDKNAENPQNKIKLPDFIVHSMNPIGKENIIGLYKNYLDKVEGRKDRDGEPLLWTEFHIGIIDGELILQNLQ